jgi:hypothetical protein
MYTDDFAEILKKRAGEKWRPSNGTEGDIFMDAYCGYCRREIGCEILAASLVCEVDHPNYPSEWQIGTDGQPTCTVFDPITQPEAKGGQ